MVSKKFLDLIDLFKAQVFYIYKIIKIIIIYKNKYLVFVIFQIIKLYYRNFNNIQKFIIMNFILSFCKKFFFRKKYYQMLLTQIGLNNYSIKIKFQKSTNLIYH